MYSIFVVSHTRQQVEGSKLVSFQYCFPRSLGIEFTMIAGESFARETIGGVCDHPHQTVSDNSNSSGSHEYVTVAVQIYPTSEDKLRDLVRSFCEEHCLKLPDGNDSEAV
ncbi:MAG: hypothetical protein COU07_01740 [Candidatus Harrisonbacteria bacterium CG10_big_fil_rev_8_21_14_0_10_40_38]|uniref:Uncharacterized protein n=1 Tax=Candidatus Harrisonbacteria bacterium CG10_big_fil_rev_8_21_14_0_10_40_38 TaxID=1974583 RepID=A0A2H0UT62_9BACT|nr:MAG: hypothetical protein COU07_01740 [Candidatus Harrisonbacteria bacterium CG10_big_fil_rev_8_21_14_0_10_40_38]